MTSRTNRLPMESMDGNAAAAHAAYALTEVAAIYPITPSSPMAELCDEWAAYGRRNIFDETVKVVQLQSEAGAAGAVHGALQAGALSATFTASQGLLLMIPNMYKMAGELLPAVIHVSARSLSTHALSIFGDHSDVYAARQTGFAMLASGGVQEVMDLAGVAHLAAIEGGIPFLHFFDGFRTSHEVQKIEVIPYEELSSLVNTARLAEFRANALNPEKPVTRGTAQNPDVYFQGREAQERFYRAIPDIAARYMNGIGKITGRDYRPFNYYGAPDAENIVIAMGSVTETIRTVVDRLVENGEKVGCVAVHLYRPFSEKHFFDVIPSTVGRIAVLDRTKEPGALGEPLYLDVRAAFYGKSRTPLVVGGRYGLSSKDTTPEQILAVFHNLRQNDPHNGFTIGITDDVNFSSLPVNGDFPAQKDVYEAKFFGIGSDGTVGANKNSIKVIGETTDLYTQAYFAYDSKKSGGVTVSHLRFGKAPIRSTYLVNHPDFVACHVPSYLTGYDVLAGLKAGGAFLLNCPWKPGELGERLPSAVKRYLALNDIRLYIIDASGIAEWLGMPGRTNTIMQAAFFKVSDIIPYESAVAHLHDAIIKTYGKKGDDVVALNLSAVDRGGSDVVRVPVPPEWKNAKEARTAAQASGKLPHFVNHIAIPINRLKGDRLPVSAFASRPDGSVPQGTAAYEKRGISSHVPVWWPERCIQCNRCSLVCPHAAIRPFLCDEAELKTAPGGFACVDALGKQLAGFRYRIQVSPLDCYGCGNCVEVCPSREKALTMEAAETQKDGAALWEFAVNGIRVKSTGLSTETIKGSQFVRPLFEFSGACAGCGETPYIKLVTQLFGTRMMVANATGCSSIYCGSYPSTPFCADHEGRGPAWASSLFEDNAEYGYGMYLGASHLRERAERRLVELAGKSALPGDIRTALDDWMAGKDLGSAASGRAARRLSLLLEISGLAEAREIHGLLRFLEKKSIWIIGGDGWAYDIGYGGLDHVLASGDDVNVLVLDTEVYSNTGGQSSKATPTGAVAKFAASGKKTAKKDLGLMALSYGYIYVAQVAMGADPSQCQKAIMEAESYPGPSIIIAYSSCINHGIKTGMGDAQREMKRAVECGYWHLYRYDPRRESAGENPFTLDSKEPDWSGFDAFLSGESRYAMLRHEFPMEAERLFGEAERDCRRRYERYRKLAGGVL